jgi:hypothetical protein
MENDFNVKEIVRVESKGADTYLHLTNGYSEKVGNSIDDLEKEFSDWNFVRIHSRHLINPLYYYKPSRFVTPAIEMMDGTLLLADKYFIKLNTLVKRQDSWWKRVLQILKSKLT